MFCNFYRARSARRNSREVAVLKGLEAAFSEIGMNALNRGRFAR
jgi:hypothetical protein